MTIKLWILGPVLLTAPVLTLGTTLSQISKDHAVYVEAENGGGTSTPSSIEKARQDLISRKLGRR